MTATKTITMHFVVDGEGLTSIVRNVWSYDPPKALAILANIGGLSVEDAHGILKGKKKLIGQTVCDDNECRQCRGRVPMKLAKDRAPDFYAVQAKWKANGAVREQKELAQDVERLEREELEREEDDVLSRYTSTMEGRMAVGLARLGITGAAAEGPMAMLKTLMEPLPEGPVSPDDFTMLEGWLSPDGAWYSCEYGRHGQLADRILQDSTITEAEAHLDKIGWMKVHQPLLVGKKVPHLLIHPECKVTAAQRDAIGRWFEKHQTDFKWDGTMMNYRGWLAVLREE